MWLFYKFREVMSFFSRFVFYLSKYIYICFVFTFVFPLAICQPCIQTNSLVREFRVFLKNRLGNIMLRCRFKCCDAILQKASQHLRCPKNVSWEHWCVCTHTYVYTHTHVGLEFRCESMHTNWRLACFVVYLLYCVL